MKNTFRRRLTLSFLIIFVVFTSGIVIFEQMHARRYKTEALEEKLDAYSEMVNAWLHSGGEPENLDSLLGILPRNLRLTCISPSGSVMYDNLFGDPAGLENHSARPEVRDAKDRGAGSDIRTSASNNQPYLYYAKYFGDMFIRVALPYDIQVRHFLKPDNAFLYFIIVLFVLGLVLINYTGSYFGNSIRKLRDFSTAVSHGGSDVPIPRFPKDELGEIGGRIAESYNQLSSSESQLALEREKLLQHVQSSAEGVCFFNEDNSVAFYNGLFLQYLTVISDNADDNINIFSLESFRPTYEFLTSFSPENYFETSISSHGREFLLRLNRFEDNSFEIVLNDVSGQQKTRRLKREMTANIAHELRTPVTSIRGYLETIIETPLTDEQRNNFLGKAYMQTLTVSELIRDIGLLTRIEESPDSFGFKPVRIGDVIDRIEGDLRTLMEENGTVIERHFSPDLTVNGNESLVHSIFRNLTDNVVKHAGKGARIEIKEGRTFRNYVYITFSDTGRGIEGNDDMGRLFERFYRADKGRTRDAGGSGLGLAIVKNAINIHRGAISAKPGSNGGIIFNFTLPVA